MERYNLWLSVLALLAGCGSSNSESQAPKAVVRFADMEIISPANLSVWFDREPVTFTVSLQEDGLALNLPVTWSSDIDGPLTVSNNLAMLSDGIHNIRASVNAEGVVQNKQVTVAVVRESDVIEGLVLGTGELAVSSGENPSCPRDQEWGTWKQGSNIVIKLPNTLSEDQVVIVQDFVEVVQEVSSNNLLVSIEQVESTADAYVTGEVSVVPISASSEDCNGSRGCADHQFNADKSITSAVVKIRDGADEDVTTHELGHAVLGFCHIDAAKIAGDNSIMASPKRVFGATRPLLPTPLDILAFQRVFLSGAQPGATRQDLVDIGVLEPVE